MAIPKDRTAFQTYCLRRLGAPVIQINVSPDQIDDRIDDALQVFGQFHTDAVEHVFLPYQIKDADITNEYLSIPPEVISIESLVPLLAASGGDGMFNVQYQMRVTDWDAFYSGGSIAGYDIAMQSLDMLQFEFDPNYSWDFNQHQQRLFVRWDWKNNIAAGDYVIIECYRVLNPSDFADIWSDKWLKEYATELIRRQWGENLMKFQGTTLPGGVTLNGTAIYQQALQNIARLDAEVRSTYQMPAGFLVG